MSTYDYLWVPVLPLFMNYGNHAKQAFPKFRRINAEVAKVFVSLLLQTVSFKTNGGKLAVMADKK